MIDVSLDLMDLILDTKSVWPAVRASVSSGGLGTTDGMAHVLWISVEVILG